MSEKLPRRAFLGGAAGIALAACKSSADEPPTSVAAGEGRIATPPPAKSTASIPTRELGRTGALVSIVGLGGFHIGVQDSEQESIRIIRSAMDRGVTFLDNCWDYNRGASEARMGKALRDGYRARAFVMTKIDGRTKKVAAQQIDQSLRRLGVDYVDLLQIHEVIRTTDPARCFAAGGCVEALVDAKKAGKVRFLGFTGHKDPDMHVAMLKAADDHGFAFDTMQIPLNVMDAHFKSFERRVLPLALEKGMGILGMKSLGSGLIVRSGTVSATDCLHYTMNLPTSVVITGCETMRDLDQAIEAARSFSPMQPAEVQALLAKTEEAARDGRYELFKTSTRFDGTVRHPEWLDSASVG